ncbi:MAG: O-antigen ligase family protein [Gemmataceae bacterium]
MFYPLFVGLIAWILYLATTRGAREALWLGWLPAMMLLPAWITTRSGALVIDLRTGAALAVLLGFLISGETRYFHRFVLGDLLMLGLVATMIISQYQVGPFTPLTGPEMVRRWMLPYLMGRLFLADARDVDRVVPIIARLLLILSLLAIFESVSKVNPVNRILGKTYGLLEQGEGYRMGLKRAQGTLDHPIFFGMMLVMIFPWAVEAWRRGRRGLGPKWWRWLPLFTGGALFCTVSRGPQIAGIFTFLATIFFRRPAWRLPLLGGVLLLGGLAYVNKALLLEISAHMSGEAHMEQRIITIDDEEVEYSGTNHRVLLFKVYREAIARTGWFGYGYSLRNVPIDPEQADRFGSIDNHYLLFLLQHGWSAILAFLSLGICSVIYLMRAGWRPDLPQAGIAGSLSGAMAAVLVLLMSVWFSPDFGGVWLFNAGLASALHALPAVSPTVEEPRPTETDVPVARPTLVRRPRLTAGHAPIRP